MAESSSSESSDYITASASEIQTVRSSSRTPSQIYRSFMSANASRPSVKDERRIKVFETLEKFVRSHGGSIISPPGARFLRIECPRGSDLPVKLAHYNPVAAGSTMRTTNLGLFPADVFEISLD
jgi:hypothetical protein